MQAVKILSGKEHAKQSFLLLRSQGREALARAEPLIKRFAVLLYFPNCYVSRTAIAFFCKGKHGLILQWQQQACKLV